MLRFLAPSGCSVRRRHGRRLGSRPHGRAAQGQAALDRAPKKPVSCIYYICTTAVAGFVDVCVCKCSASVAPKNRVVGDPNLKLPLIFVCAGRPIHLFSSLAVHSMLREVVGAIRDTGCGEVKYFKHAARKLSGVFVPSSESVTPTDTSALFNCLEKRCLPRHP